MPSAVARPKTIVLGAGIAGLSAARNLIAAGHRVQVVEQASSVGGRLSTRQIGDARVDHGAQFFTTRGERFTALTAAAVDAGVVHEWCRGFGEPDGYPRYRGENGMSSFANWLARDLDISLNVTVDRVRVDSGQVRFEGADGSTIVSGQHAVVTAPVPQMMELLDRGKVCAEAELDRLLRSTDYFTTLALLAIVDREPNVAAPGGMQLEDGPFTFISENRRKGISPVHAMTFHAAHEYSRRRRDDDHGEVRAELLELAKPWIGPAHVTHAELTTWHFAGPVQTLPQATYIIEHDGVTIALAGDAFAGPKVEGAFNSGVAAAEALSS